MHIRAYLAAGRGACPASNTGHGAAVRSSQLCCCGGPQHVHGCCTARDRQHVVQLGRWASNHAGRVFQRCVQSCACLCMRVPALPRSSRPGRALYKADSCKWRAGAVVGQPTVENCLLGFNSSIFAYGQTGSGKTHTMIGDLPAAEGATSLPPNVRSRQCSHELVADS